MRVNEPLVKPALSIKRVLVRRRTVFESAAVSRCGCSDRRRRQKSPDQSAGLMCRAGIWRESHQGAEPSEAPDFSPLDPHARSPRRGLHGEHRSRLQRAIHQTLAAGRQPRQHHSGRQFVAPASTLDPDRHCGVHRSRLQRGLHGAHHHSAPNHGHQEAPQ